MSGIEHMEAQPDYNWQEFGNCLSVPPDVMFPEKGDGLGARAAKLVCANCDVIEFCLEDALKTPEPYGYRGGMSPREQRHLSHKSREQYIADRHTETLDKARQARAMRAEGDSLQRIAQKLGYATHASITYLLRMEDEEASA